MLQPVKVGCVWASEQDGGADLKLLRQFTACLLEAAPSEEEQAPKASRREKRDQQSECGRAGLEGRRGPGSRVGDRLENLVLSTKSKSQRLPSTSVRSLMLTRAVRGSCFTLPVSLRGPESHAVTAVPPCSPSPGGPVTPCEHHARYSGKVGP